MKVIACRNPKEWEIDYSAEPKSVKGADGLYHMAWGGSDIDVKLNRLFEEAAKAYKAKRAVGLMVQIPYADGYAYYRVVQEKPLTLEHIPYGDAWAVPMWQLKGLTIKDIRKMNGHM